MSASLFYHVFGTNHICYLSTHYENGEVLFHICNKYKCCSKCGSDSVIQKGYRYRKIRTIPFGSKPVILMIKVRRLHCKKCWHLGSEDISRIVESKKGYSKNWLNSYASCIN